MSHYTSLTLKKTIKVPYYYRCSRCSALNVGMCPITGTSSYDGRNSGVRPSTQQQVMMERKRDARRHVDEAIRGRLYVYSREILAEEWKGDPTISGECKSCGNREIWGRMKPLSKAGEVLLYVMALSFMAGFVTFCLTQPDSPWPVILGLWGLAILSLAVMLILGPIRKKLVRPVPEINRPHIFETTEEVQAALSKERKGDEALYVHADAEGQPFITA